MSSSEVRESVSALAKNTLAAIIVLEFVMWIAFQGGLASGSFPSVLATSCPAMLLARGLALL